MTRRTLTIVLCLFGMPLLAQRANPAEERYRMFQEYLVRRASEITQQNLSDLNTKAKWEQRRPEIRKQLLYMLGLDPMPPRTPLNARVTGGFERDAYRVENVVFESMPKLYVTGNLYLPKRRSGKLPAVVYLCGHTPDPAGAKAYYQYNGVTLARLGYVVLMIDPLHFGELPGVHHGLHNLGMWYWLSLGYTPAGPEAWNVVRALDYLETRSEVDARRIAVTGNSGGGSTTWYAAAIDERIQVAVPMCSSWTAENQAAQDAVKENCDCMYFPNTFLLDFPIAGALIAPRPLQMLSAMRDPMFPPGGYHEVYRRSRLIYDLYHAGEHVAEYDHDAGHGQTAPSFRKRAYEWINRWLRNDPGPFDVGEPKPQEEPRLLTVFDRLPADAVNDSAHKIFIRTHKLTPWKTLDTWKKRRAELTAELNDKVFRAFPKARAPFAVRKMPETGWTSRYAQAWDVEFATEEGIRVTGQLFVPRGPVRAYPALIQVKGAEDIVYPVDYDFILPVLKSHVVLVLQPRAVDYPVDNFRMATLKRTAALVGATIESMQIWDILRSVDFLVDEEKLRLESISVYGRRQMGALGIYAAALDERITRVILDDPPATHWQGPALLNVLRITDLPEAAALIAPREIVSLTPLPWQYRYTTSVFSLYGATQGLRQRNGLFDALSGY